MSLNETIFQFKNFIHNISTLTLSGEIIITSKDPSISISNNEEVCSKVSSITKEFGRVYKEIEFQVNENIHEISIKMFTFNKKISEEYFFENLKNSLEQLIKTLYNINDINVRLNVIGELKNLKNKEKFQYINDKDKVLFRTTELETDSIINNIYKKVVK